MLCGCGRGGGAAGGRRPDGAAVTEEAQGPRDREAGGLRGSLKIATAKVPQESTQPPTTTSAWSIDLSHKVQLRGDGAAEQDGRCVAHGVQASLAFIA